MIVLIWGVLLWSAANAAEPAGDKPDCLRVIQQYKEISRLCDEIRSLVPKNMEALARIQQIRAQNPADADRILASEGLDPAAEQSKVDLAEKEALPRCDPELSRLRTEMAGLSQKCRECSNLLDRVDRHPEQWRMFETSVHGACGVWRADLQPAQGYSPAATLARSALPQNAIGVESKPTAASVNNAPAPAPQTPSQAANPTPVPGPSPATPPSVTASPVSPQANTGPAPVSAGTAAPTPAGTTPQSLPIEPMKAAPRTDPRTLKDDSKSNSGWDTKGPKEEAHPRADVKTVEGKAVSGTEPTSGPAPRPASSRSGSPVKASGGTGTGTSASARTISVSGVVIQSPGFASEKRDLDCTAGSSVNASLDACTAALSSIPANTTARENSEWLARFKRKIDADAEPIHEGIVTSLKSGRSTLAALGPRRHRTHPPEPGTQPAQGQAEGPAVTEPARGSATTGLQGAQRGAVPVRPPSKKKLPTPKADPKRRS